MMFDPRLDYDNNYPVQLAAPDIAPYKKADTGVDYVHTFDSKSDGPHIGITAVVHGNEICGAIALDWLFKQNPRPKRGKLTLGFMNTDAYLAFDPAKANLTRWLEEDFNRLWAADVLHDDNRKLTIELARARMVRPIIARLDLLLDLHSMQTPCPPIILSGAHPKGRNFAGKIGMKFPVLSDEGHIEGRRMRDYGEFGNAGGDKNALLIECGQHWEKSSGDIAVESMLRFIRRADIMDEHFGLDYLDGCTNEGNTNFYQVGTLITVETENFHFAENWSGFEHLPKGTLIGRDDDRKIIAPYEPTVLIMPTKQPLVGKTAVRLAYPIERD